MEIKHFKDLKLKVKLGVGFGLVIVLMIILAAAAILCSNRIQKNFLYYVNEVEKVDNAVKLCRIETNNGARNLREMALTDDMDARAGYKVKADEAIASLGELLNTLKTSTVIENSLYTEYETEINSWIAIGTAIEETLTANETEKGVKMILEQCSPSLESVINTGTKISGITERLKTEAVTQNETTIMISIIIIIVLLTLGVIFGIAVAVKIAAGVISPLKEISAVSKNISNGNMDNKIVYKSGDELGVLADDFRRTDYILTSIISDITSLMNDMANGNFDVHTSCEELYLGQFKPVLSAMRKMNVYLSDTMRLINEASGQVASGSEQVASGSQALAQGATEQASAVDELLATMTDVEEQVEKTSQNADDTNKLTVTTAAEVVFCGEQMAHMLDAMSVIGKKSDEIKKIIKSIEDLAFQTNILSLNAAVEAARAGSAGKGFAVVADEVRSLAALSSESSKSTAELIQQTIQAVQNGIDAAKATSASLDKIKTAAMPISDKVETIAVAAKQQSESAKQLIVGIRQVSDVVQTNSATAEESAAASEELSAQAQSMRTLVKQFKLKEK